MNILNRGRFWALLFLLTVVVLLTAGYHWLLANLDDPRVKGMVNSYLREHRGVEIDYDRLELSPLGGRLVVEGLRVLSPPPYREYAPLFLDLERLTARWSPRSLLRQEILIQEVQVTGLALHWVQGADGQTTLDFFRTEEAPSEPVPLSHTLQMAELPRALRVESFTLSGLLLTWSEIDDNGAVLYQGGLDGLETAAQLGITPGAVAARLEFHSPHRTEGTRVTYREPAWGKPQEADLHLGLRFQMAESRTVDAAVEIDLLRQSFEEAFTKTGRVFEMEAAAIFDAQAQASRFALQRLVLLDDVARASFSAVLADTSSIPVLESGVGSFHLDPLLAVWPGLMADVEGEKVHLDYHIYTEPADGRLVPKLKISGEVGRLIIGRGDQAAEVQGLSLHGEGAAMSPDCAAFSFHLPVDSIRIRDGDRHQARLTGVNIASMQPS
jgi:translocation and assembly module TamB